MKPLDIATLCTIALLFAACSDGQKPSNNEAIQNPVNTYLDSRTDAIDLAKKSVQESNKRTAEQNEATKELNGASNVIKLRH